MFRQESAVEYFKGLIVDAIAHQRIEAGELTSFYIVHLLAGRLQRPTNEDDETPLALRLAEALDAGGVQRRASLRQIGDVALFISGLFPDSLRRKLVDVDYYSSIGSTAYITISRCETDTFSPVFAELARKFVGFVDALSEVSELACCTSSLDVLRLYERWLKTGNSRSGQLLLEWGVVPHAAAKTNRIQ